MGIVRIRQFYLRRAALVAGLIVLSVLLVACARGTSSPTAPTPTAPAATISTPAATVRPTTSTPAPTGQPLKTAKLHPGLIAYTQNLKDGLSLFTMTSDGANQAPLATMAGSAFVPRWSPDGKLIAFFFYEAKVRMVNVWVKDMKAGGSPRQVTQSGAQQPMNLMLSWSPDNRYLVYSSPQADDTEQDVYRLEVASGKVVDLTGNSTVWDATPAWSPDGKWIAFASDRADKGKDRDNIWIMAPDGSGLKNLTRNTAHQWENKAPAWSPDGKEIAFYRWDLEAKADTPGGPAGLWVIAADGGQERLVAAFDGIMSPEPPVWSPDGKLIAFLKVPTGDGNVWVAPAAGGDARQIGDLKGECSSISWSPDSQAVLFTNTLDNAMQLYVAEADGSSTLPLFDTPGYGPGHWSPAAR